jgi:hypothetical protein
MIQAFRSSFSGFLSPFAVREKDAARLRRPIAGESREFHVMADDDRKRAPGQHEAQRSTSDPADVVLPEHASAYFSPHPPPTSSSNPTLETEAVRLDPAIDPDEAPTQPVKIVEPPAWLGVPLQSDAPTVLVPIVRARRRRRVFAALAAALVGVAAGVVYGFSRPIPSARVTASPSLAGGSSVAAPTAGSTLDFPTAAPPTAAPTPAAPEDEAPSVASDPSSIATAVRPVPTRPGQKGRPTSAASGAPSAWFKSAPPKPWFK